MLPVIANEKLADYIDVFCETVPERFVTASERLERFPESVEIFPESVFTVVERRAIVPESVLISIPFWMTVPERDAISVVFCATVPESEERFAFVFATTHERLSTVVESPRSVPERLLTVDTRSESEAFVLARFPESEEIRPL
jgi:hypothetical protein